MTLPSQEKNALLEAHDFLVRLLRPQETPRVPLRLRKEARQILRHYPYRQQIEEFYENE